MCWTAFAAIGAWFTGIIIFISVFILRKQVMVMYRSLEAQNYIATVNFLQNENTVNARTLLLSSLKGKEFGNWTEEEKSKVAWVGRSYDVAAILVYHKMLSKEIIFNWGDSLVKCWNALSPLIKERKEEENWDVWHNFYKLAKEASEKFKKELKDDC